MPDEDGLIATHYRIDPLKPGPALQGGLRGFSVIDRRDPAIPLMAIETRPDLPARPRITLARSGPPVPHTVLPIEYGCGRDLSGHPGWFIVSDALPAVVGTGRPPWREADLIAYVLRPAAEALAALQALGLTHRAINPDNLFRAGPRDPVMLGPFWAAPPASLQPALYEPPYMARCLPSSRGDGTIADDIYALGVTLLVLALGRVPLVDKDEAAVLRLKMEVGSYAALTADTALPPLISDLLRGMLAEDPDHRPAPALLLRPEQARARRVAARPPRRAQQTLNLGGIPVWSSRDLALALSQRPERGYTMLKNGEVEHWIRRCLGDSQLGMHVEEVTRRGDAAQPDDARAQALLVMRSIAAIDPLAPLVWRGLAFQPDGLGTALVGASRELSAAIEELVLADSIGQFHAANENRPDQAGRREEQRGWRGWLVARGPAGGLNRLVYGANPLLACASPLLGGQPVVRVADLLPALDSAASGSDRTRPPIDPHIAAFLAARLDAAHASELVRLTSFASPAERLIVLRLFGDLQRRLHPVPLIGLAGWLVSSGFASVETWRNQGTRAVLQDKVAQAAEQGRIDVILETIDDDAARQADLAGARQAAERAVQLQRALDDAASEAGTRADVSELLGHEIVTGAGLLASLGAALALALQ